MVLELLCFNTTAIESENVKLYLRGQAELDIIKLAGHIMQNSVHSDGPEGPIGDPQIAMMKVIFFGMTKFCCDMYPEKMTIMHTLYFLANSGQGDSDAINETLLQRVSQLTSGLALCCSSGQCTTSQTEEKYVCSFD